jgi:hypothetical protein
MRATDGPPSAASDLLHAASCLPSEEPLSLFHPDLGVARAYRLITGGVSAWGIAKPLSSQTLSYVSQARAQAKEASSAAAPGVPGNWPIGDGAYLAR